MLLKGAEWGCLRGCSQDGLVKAVGGFVDVEVVSLNCFTVFISKARERLPVSLLLIPYKKGLWVAGPVLQVDCQLYWSMVAACQLAQDLLAGFSGQVFSCKGQVCST